MSKKLQIGIFVELWKPHTSGVINSVTTLVREMQKRGYEVIVFTPYIPHYEDREGFKVIRLKSLLPFSIKGFRFSRFWLCQGLVDQVRDLNLDLIHIQGPYPTGILGVLLGKKLNIPVVMTYHTNVLLYLDIWMTSWKRMFLWFAKWITLQAIRYVSSGCKLIIAPSKFIKREIEGYGIESSKIEVLPTGIKVPNRLPNQFDARIALGLPIDKLILLYCGRVTKEKNLDMLIDAFEYVSNRRDDVILVIVGEGFYLSGLKRKVIEKGLKEKVYFVGVIPPDEVWKYYAAADIFVFPSISEVQGLVVQEAMSTGLPVVVVQEGGASEIVGNKIHGFVTSCDYLQFGASILELAKNPTFMQACGYNAIMAVSCVHPDIVYKKLEGIYSRVIGASVKSI
ncbi:MAG: glycosyltransferase [Candidatus Berkelbacteria bacterium]|nr:glycosyltransferase [Candidatus Berkelbacteria bacterium]